MFIPPMLKVGQNWGKIPNYSPQCSTKICTPGPIKNKLVKDYSVEESLPLGQVVSLGRLRSRSWVTTDRQSATWSARALGRQARSKNQRHSSIRLGTLEVFVEEVWRYVKS